MFARLKQKDFGWYALASVAVLFLLYFQLTRWQSGFIGFVLFIAYLACMGYVWRLHLGRFFDMKERSWVTTLFALLSVITLLGLLSGVFVSWHRFTPFIMWIVYALTTCISFALFFVSKKSLKKKVYKKNNDEGEKLVAKPVTFLKQYHLMSLLYLALWVLTLALMIVSRSDGALMSPWQAMHPFVLPLIFLLTLMVGAFLLSKFKIKTILFFILLHSILIHAYIPLAHSLPWGGDVWRHIGIEQQIMQGEAILPVLFGGQAEWKEVLGADIPAVLVSPNKYVYSHLWGLTTLLSQTLQVDSKAVNIWLVPILWSLFFPIIMFRMGRLLFGSWRKGLWLGWLSMLVFPLQALGGLSLPVSLGYLTFFFALMLWLQYVGEGRVWQRRIVLALALLMLFGYTLHAILIWTVIVATLVLRHMGAIQHRLASVGAYTAIFFASVFIFPAIEIVSRISYMPRTWDGIAQLKQLLGQFTGWFYASGIRPHDMLSGNMLFNHTPDYAFVSSLFTDFRWHVIVVSVLVYALAKYGVFQFLQRGASLSWQLVLFLSSTIVGGYIVGWFVLSGDRLFTRRMDGMFAFLVIVLFLLGLSLFLKHRVRGAGHRKLVVSIFIVLLSWFGATALASGPDMRVVSEAEYAAAALLWDSTEQLPGKPCVIADSWVLLALEGMSGQKIVGGGFPIDYQFGQPERVLLYHEIQQEPRESIFEFAHEKTGADLCWVVLQKDTVSDEKLLELKGFFEADPSVVGDQYIWVKRVEKEEEE